MVGTIAIAGSVDPAREQKLGLENLGSAQAACEALGRALADAGFGIVVYSSDADFVEAAVVTGYVGSGKAGAGSIQVLVHDVEHASFPEMEEDDPRFQVTVNPSGAWEVSFYRSLFSVDGLLLIGGGQSTLVAGLIALSLRTPIVALNTFGGRARDVWKRLDANRNDATEDHFNAMGRPWTAGAETPLVAALREQQLAKAKREDEERAAARGESRRRAISLGIGAAVLLAALAAIVIVYKTTPGSTPSMVALFIGPSLAGLAGAIFRTALYEGTKWFQAAILGFGAGVIASLLFVASQLATSPDALEETGVRTLVVFMLVIGLIAGVTFDAVFAKLRKEDVVDTAALHPN